MTDASWEKALNDAYGDYLARTTQTDFVRGPGGLPLVQTAPDGSAYVELESLEWGTRARVSLKEPSIMEQVAGGKNIGRVMLADRMDHAVRELQEPPPLWVGP